MAACSWRFCFGVESQNAWKSRTVTQTMQDDILNELSPFGNPEGSRASIDEITDRFISFDGPSHWGGVSTIESDPAARVLVGRKGSGKSVYLRRLQAYAAQQVGLQADDIQQDVPATQNVIKVCHWFPDHLLTEVWMQLWQRALIRSLVSHLLCHPRVSGQIDSSSRERLKNASEVLIRSFSAHVSVYSQIDEIINSSHSRNHLEQYLSNSKWP